MKVKDLEKGMLLKPEKGFKIIMASHVGAWLSVEQERKKYNYHRPLKYCSSKSSSNLALYIGTKDDVGDSAESWCNRYVLYENKICAVEPASWKYIHPANEQ